MIQISPSPGTPERVVVRVCCAYGVRQTPNVKRRWLRFGQIGITLVKIPRLHLKNECAARIPRQKPSAPSPRRLNLRLVAHTTGDLDGFVFDFSNARTPLN